MRRRSTLHWSTASPRTRQQKLEEVASSRLADTWFSIHSAYEKDPIYISEVVENSMNPSFAFFDLDNCIPQVSRAEDCIVRIWAKAGNMSDYCLLIELKMNLRSLQFIGRDLENFHHPLPQNCVLIHMSDGIYTSFTDLPAEPQSAAGQHLDSKAFSTTTGSSFDALMQLANLDDCIQDAINTRAQLEAEINSLLSKMHENDGNKHRNETRDSPATRSAIANEDKRKTQLMKRKVELQQSLSARRQAMGSQAEAGIALKERINTLRKTQNNVVEQMKVNTDQTSGQIRRISENVLSIFPIEPVKNKALHFTIRGIHLPNSAYDDTNRDEIAAALGFTAQLTQLLALYLSMSLPYPIDGTASQCFIHDPISIGIAQRRFPLHPTNVAYKFEYGVFLLNKDIEFLMNRVGLRVLDIRHTLPNLKYLLYVLTAGTGELPARKAGGVRGLLGGRVTPSVSRRGSDDSFQNHNGVFMKRGSLETELNGSSNKSQEKATELEDPFYSSPQAVGLPYRYKASRKAS